MCPSNTEISHEIDSAMASSSYAWEFENRQDDDDDFQSCAGDREDGNLQDDDDDDQDEKPISTEEGGVRLAEYLLDLRFKGVLSAKQLCVIAFLANAAGAKGVDKLSFNPSASSGHFNRHLEGVLGLRDEDERNYEYVLPGFKKWSATRTEVSVKCNPFHESLSDECDEDPSIATAVREKCEKGLWPRRFSEHPVVKSATADETVVPYILYLDATPYSNDDSVLGIFAYTAITEKRHLFCPLRKRDLCRCGCRGWCSLFHVFSVARWCIEAGAKGVWPDVRHDGSPFGRGDDLRAGNKGARMKHKFALLYLKGDWSEYCSTLGFPLWNSVLDPCIWCETNRDLMYTIQGLSVGQSPFGAKTPATYDAACGRCEIRVRLHTPADLNEVRLALFYDKRKHGNRGRCLNKHIDRLGLRVGDRLEPHLPGLSDVGNFELLQTPCEVLFWRCQNETAARHRNPMFNSNVGCDIDALTVDVMHCMHLGVIQRWISYSWWSLCLANAFGTNSSNEDELLRQSVQCLANMYHAWLPSWKKEHPEEERSATEVPEITMKTLGPKGSYLLKAKAMMTRPLLPFTLWVLQRYPGKFEGQAACKDAGVALEGFLGALRKIPAVVSILSAQALWEKMCISN